MKRLLDGATRRFVGALHRRPFLALGVATVVSAIAVAAGEDLTLERDIHHLLPDGAPTVTARAESNARLGHADTLVIALHTTDVAAVEPVLSVITGALEGHPDVARVEHRGDLMPLDANGLVYFAELAELAAADTELSALVRTDTGRQVQLLDDGAPPPEGPRLDPAMDGGLMALDRAIEAARTRWRGRLYGDGPGVVRLWVHPTAAADDLEFSRRVVADTDEIVRTTLGRTLAPVGRGAPVERVELGGRYPDMVSRIDAIGHDIASSVSFAFGLLALVVVVWFQSLRAFFCVLGPLVVGVSWMLGLTAVTVGAIDLVTGSVFAVLLGVGIDFGIHFYGRYHEERSAGRDPLEAMVNTHLTAGASCIVAALTTAAAFVALTLTDFRGFSRFGALAAIGVGGCLLAVFWVFTAGVFVFERISPLRWLGYRVEQAAPVRVDRRRFPLGAGTVVLALAIGVAGIASYSQVDFQPNLDVTAPTAADHEGGPRLTAPVVVLATDRAEARSLYDQLDGAAHIGQVDAPFALVPTQQGEKIDRARHLCRTLGHKANLFGADDRPAVDRILRGCDVTPADVDGLPADLRARFTERDGRVGAFLRIHPPAAAEDGLGALALRDTLRSLKGTGGSAPAIAGQPIARADVLDILRRDGPKTAAASLLTVLLLVLLVERSLRTTALILVPLVMALGLSGAVLALFDIDLTLFNVVALPTVIGMGVDAGVHLQHRHRALGRHGVRHAVRTTGMAVVLTTLTTGIGFGSLMLTGHPGLSSLGLLAIIGMVSAVFATLVILPAALQWLDDRLDQLDGPTGPTPAG